jgi:hypothetical protein
MRRSVLVALVVLLAACGGGGKTAAAGPKQFLLTMHSPLAGEISTKPDAELVQLGQTACAGLDQHQTSDAVVTTMSGGALPGSAAYNEYAFLLASAATHLCTAHQAEMQELPKGLLPDG